MAGEDPAAATTAARNILSLETKLAQASRKLEDLRDPYTNYNKMAITDLGEDQLFYRLVRSSVINGC